MPVDADMGDMGESHDHDELLIITRKIEFFMILNNNVKRDFLADNYRQKVSYYL